MICAGIAAFFVQSAVAATANTRIARWKDDKKGAFSLRFDDSMQSHHDYCIPQLVKRGLVGSFWVNPSTPRYGYGVDTWESLASRTGIELCDHSMDHNGANFIEEADYEIGETARIIRSLNPPEASPLLLFSRGGGSVWPEGYGYLIKKHKLISGDGGMKHYRGPISADNLIAYARRAMEEGVWNGVATHGTGPYLEWDGLRPEVFEPLVDYLASVKDRLWVGTCGDVHKYVTERDSAEVNVLETSKNFIRVKLTSTVDPDLYDYPLTLMTEVPDSWKYCRVTQGILRSIYPVKSGVVQYEAVPGRGEIRIESSAMDITPPSVPVVRDGLGIDISYTPYTDRLSANWDTATDNESGISRYWYRIGTTPGGSEVLDWIDNGYSTGVTVTRTNLSLIRGESYYFTVKAVNGVGLSSEGISNGQVVLETPDCIRFREDFEKGDLGQWDEVSQEGKNMVSTSREAARDGRYGLRCRIKDSPAGSVVKNEATSDDHDNYARFFFRLSPDFKLPESKRVQLVDIRNNVGFFVAGLYISADNNGPYLFAECVDNKRQPHSLPVAAERLYPFGLARISKGVWHSVVLRIRAERRTGGYELWVDGDRKNSFLHRFTNGFGLKILRIGAIQVGKGISGEIFFDDITISDSYLPSAE